jgi:hypothetical protein
VKRDFLRNWYGAKKLGYPKVISKYLGFTLIAQAGVAIRLRASAHSQRAEAH